MRCKHCNAMETNLDFDTLSSTVHCFFCGYYLHENGETEIEIIPYCLIIVNDILHQSFETRKGLLEQLRNYRTVDEINKITLKKYLNENGKYIKKTFFI